jgi:hypothetical protein
MTAKREPRTGKSPARSKAKAKAKRSAASPALSESAVLVMLETAEPAGGHAELLSELRQELIATEAYFRAERRGFAPGHELEDWIAAEAAVDSRLRSTAAA